ncbi:MAG TPA: hypothetical protein DDW49_07105 [Deltaproteobacteria bacterium]|nr:hypothetical protein [Deltaproteobacteria bacterium]
MKKIFVDTNILLDIFLERVPFFRPAQVLWTLAENRKIQAGISALAVSHVFFIIQRKSSTDAAYKAITALTETFRIVDTTSRVISKAMKDHFPDFEDGIQYHCALKFKAKAIISRDRRGFEKSKIPLMEATEYLSVIGESID